MWCSPYYLCFLELKYQSYQANLLLLKISSYELLCIYQKTLFSLSIVIRPNQLFAIKDHRIIFIQKFWSWIISNYFLLEEKFSIRIRYLILYQQLLNFQYPSPIFTRNNLMYQQKNNPTISFKQNSFLWNS